MSLASRLPSEYLRGLRSAEERARDLDLLPRDTPRLSEDDDEPEYWVIPNPMVYEDSERGSQRMDLYSRLLRDRIIFLGSDINDRVANLVTAQLLFLETQDPDKDINFYINSPGGYITSGMGMYDTMQLVKCDIATVCIGQAASMGSFLLLAGTHGKRASLPNARIMIHQPLGGARGQVSDLNIQYKEMMRTRDQLYVAMAFHTGKTVEEITTACNRDNFMSPSEAKDFGIIDKIIEARPGVATPV